MKTWTYFGSRVLERNIHGLLILISISHPVPNYDVSVFATAIHHSSVSSFISSALFDLHLRELELENMDLTAVQWLRFLPQITMPMLELLGIDVNVKLATLSKFVHRHGAVFSKYADTNDDVLLYAKMASPFENR